MKTPRINPRRWLLLITILFIGLGSLHWFRRHYHFQFDSHHLYDDATFSQWVAGWFGDWEKGPLTAALIEGPKIPGGDFAPATYRHYLEEVFPDARVEAWIEDRSGLRFTVSRLSKARTFLIHCWSKNSHDQFKYNLIARHSGNQSSRTERQTERVSHQVPGTALVAWLPTKMEIKEKGWGVRAHLGSQITLPGNEPVEDWTFHLEIQAKSENGDRSLGSFVIGFDHATKQWRLYDRDWHEMEGINSWINEEKQLEEPEFPAGFTY